MTEPSPTSRPERPAPPRPKRIGPKPVFAAGLLTFVILLGALGFQVAAGKDPALGHGKQKPKVVHHRVKRLVVTTIYDAPVYADPSAGGYGGYSDGGSGYSGAGSSTSGSTSGGGYSSSGSGSSGSSSGGYSSSGSGSSGGSSYSAPSYSAPSVSTGTS